MDFRGVDFSKTDNSNTNGSSHGGENNISPLDGETLKTNQVPVTEKKRVRIVVDEKKDSLTALSKIPSFQRRPLSDTPVASTRTSPKGSVEGTPLSSRESSLMNLPRLNNTLSANSESKFLSLLTTNDNNASPSGLDSPSRFTHPKKRHTTLDVPGLTKSKTSPDGTISTADAGSKLIIIMVGLPATGKSFITNKLSRYLNYSMYYCKAFNVGNTRRQFAKDHGLQEQDSKFFDPNNEESRKLREKWAMDTLEELLAYLLSGPGSVGIFDATNTTRDRRKQVLNTIRERSKDIQVLFLETICSDKHVVESNIKLKLFGPDYKGKDPETSLKDFKERLSNYSKAYEPIEDEEDIPYIKMIDVGKKVISHKIQGFLASQTVYYLLNFTLAERQIWITRNGESEHNVLGRIGGDSELTPRGKKYAKALSAFINQQRMIFNELELEKNEEEDKPDEEAPVNEFFVWTSPRVRCVETTDYFDEVDYPNKQMKMLEELNAGDCEGMTYKEIKQKYPEGYAERQADKLRYRYPGIGGESYMDVINRVRSVITEIERIEDNVLIVTHRVVARVLLGYFLNLSKDIIANLDIPLHCIYCLDIKPYGINWTLWEYSDESDKFFKVPHSVMNTKKVKEVGLVFREKRYSIVPTAPSSLNKSKSKPSHWSGKINESLDERTSSNSTPKNSAHSKFSSDSQPISKVKTPVSFKVQPVENAQYFKIQELETKLARLKALEAFNNQSDSTSCESDSDTSINE